MPNPFARAGLTGALCVALAVLVVVQARTERLATGEQRVLKPGYAVGDIAISNPKVCDFRVLGDRTQVMLIANGVGFTTLTLWDQRGVKRDEVTIEVISAQMAKLMADLVELVRPYPNVTVSTLGPRIVLGGTVNSKQDLDTVRALAQGAGGALCTVTLAGGGQPATPAGAPAPRFVPDPTPTSTPPAPAQPVTAGTASVVRDPTPPPPTRQPVNKAPTPVPLGGGAGQTGVSAPAAAAPPPVAVPAAAAPPPPNVVSGTRPSPPPAPAAASPSAAVTAPAPGTQGEGSIEYLVAIYESPSTAPPPEVAGPQGKRLYQARLRTEPGREVRQTITVGGTQNADPAQMRGLSLALTPRVRGEVIDSTLVFDTNLPIGRYEQKDPVWLRSQVRVSGANGVTQYVTEQALAAAAKPTGAAPPASGGPSPATRAAGAAVKDGVSTATRAVPGSQYVPSLGGLFGGGRQELGPAQGPADTAAAGDHAGHRRADRAGSRARRGDDDVSIGPGGKLTLVAGASGGCGATTVALNLAAGAAAVCGRALAARRRPLPCACLRVRRESASSAPAPRASSRRCWRSSRPRCSPAT